MNAEEVYLVAVNNFASEVTVCETEELAKHCRDELIRIGLTPERITIIPRWVRTAEDFGGSDAGV